MTTKATILLSLGTAALLMTGCGSSSDTTPTTTTEQPDNGGNTGGTTDENTNNGGETTQTQKMAGFTTDWLNGKELYLVIYDDFGYDEMKWNMASISYTNATISWEEYDTPSAGETYTTPYHIENGMIIIPDFEANVELTQVQTEDYLVICEHQESCGMRYYFDKNKAQAYRDAKNNGAHIPLTPDMLVGSTFYTRDSDGDGENAGYAYARMTFTETEGTRHEIWYNADGTVRSDDTFTFPYDLVNGKMIVEDMTFTLVEAYDFAKIMVVEKPDRSFTDTWYLSKPADFPEEI